jgi:hypothetical protein
MDFSRGLQASKIEKEIKHTHTHTKLCKTS